MTTLKFKIKYTNLPEGGLDVAALPEVRGDVPLSQVAHVDMGVNRAHPLHHLTIHES